MTEFTSLPSPAMCTPGIPKHKKPKLLHATAQALLFPRNQPHWAEAGVGGRKGFNLTYGCYVKPQDLLLIEQELADAGWWIDSIRVRDNVTKVVLVDNLTVSVGDLNKPILVKETGSAYSLARRT